MSSATSSAPTKASLIEEVFSFYSQNFTSYFAAAIAITETLPEQVNNEIRNAFTHLARASNTQNLQDVAAECDKAKSHIERANRDCLKCSIIYHHDNISKLLNSVELQYKAVPSAIIARWNHVIDERKRLLTEEHLGTNKNLTIQYQSLLLECEALQTDLRTAFGNIRKISYGRTKKFAVFVTGSLLMGLLTTAIWEMYLRDKLISPLGHSTDAAKVVKPN